MKKIKDILNDLDKIGVYNYNQILSGLTNANTIEEKLNYLKENDHYLKFVEYSEGLTSEEYELFQKVNLVERFFNKESEIKYYGTHIPNSIFEKFFKNNLTELNWWFVKQMANSVFEKWKLDPKTELLVLDNGELKRAIQDIEDKITLAELYRSNSRFSIFEDDNTNEFTEEKEILKVLSPSYYPNFPIKRWELTSRVYLKYVLKRNYLISVITKPLATINVDIDYGIPKFTNHEQVLNSLKPYFDTSQHDLIEHLIQGGNIDNKLTFKDNANKLASFFKDLFDDRQIVNCTKKDLIEWLSQNFNYFNKRKGFTLELGKKYLENIICNIDNITATCKNPIKFK